MIKIKRLVKLKQDKKKYQIIFEKNGKEYKRKFGAAGMSDFTIHKDKERRERYISRHKKDLKTEDPVKPGYLSMYILWNKPSLTESFKDYKKRINIYNRTGKFPTKISGSKKLSFGAIVPFEDTSLKVLPSDIQQMIQRNVSASDIQKVQRGKMIRKNPENMMTKKFLKQLLWKMNAEYENPEYATEQMTSEDGEPWLVLDPANKKTAQWLYYAASILTSQDFDNDELWYKCLDHIMDEFVDMDPDNIRYRGETAVNLTSSQDNLEVLLETLGHYVDFDEPRWYVRALLWLREEYATGNAFGKSKIPSNVINKKLYSSIKSKIKKSIKGRRWGAYDSGKLVKEYKALGGKYSGKKGKTNLGRWYKEKWVDACAWPKIKPCGRKTKSKIAYCRPSKKIDSKTPKLIQEFTKKQIKSRCERKKKNPMKRILDPVNSSSKFGDIKKIRQDMYNDIFLSQSSDMVKNVIDTLNKRCPNALNPKLSDKECAKRVTELMLSIYFTMIKTGDIKLSTKRKKEINSSIKTVAKSYGAPSMLNLRKKYLINEFLIGLQGGYFGMIFQGKLANDILESIIT